MADEGPARGSLRRDIMTLNVMVVLMGGMLLMLMLTLSQLVAALPYAYVAGVLLAVVGLAVVAGALYNVSMPYIAVGAALQFIGSALAAVGILSFTDLLTIVLVMAMPPLALGQYQVGACIVTIKGYTEAEGSDYGPALADLRDHMLQSIRTLTLLTFVGYGVSVSLMLFMALFQDVLALNSLWVLGLLVVAVVAGASLMLMLKGGKVVLEEVGDGEPLEFPDELPGPAGAAK